MAGVSDKKSKKNKKAEIGPGTVVEFVPYGQENAAAGGKGGVKIASDQEIIDAVKAGLSKKAMAEEIGISRQAISKRMEKLGLKTIKKKVPAKRKKVVPPNRKISDHQLRADIQAGLTRTEIAQKHNMSSVAVGNRLHRLGLKTTSMILAPKESKEFVRQTLDAGDQITKALGTVNLLMDACDAWLRDANDPTKYDIGPRAHEVSVTYAEELPTATGMVTIKRKEKLSTLLGEISKAKPNITILGLDNKSADPRELILKTAQEVRQAISTAAELAKMMMESRQMEVFRDATLEEIRKVSPEVASNIAEAVRRSIVLQGILGDAPALFTRNRREPESGA